jgi:hypothetical protein
LVSRLVADITVVYDSDIACYWLFDNGQLLDEYNTCPDCFDADAEGKEPPRASGGQPDVLMRHCRADVQQGELTVLLAEETLFAESTIERLTEAMGSIDV